MKRFLCILLILCAAGALLLVQQTNMLKTTRYDWRSERVPRAFEGFKIVQLSDLHNKRFGRGQGRLLKAIEAAGPDMIALTGDMIDMTKTVNLDAVTELLEGIDGLAPIYFINGNHDPLSPFYDDFCALLAEHDVVMLEREGWQLIERGGETMSLAPYGEADILLRHDPDVFKWFIRSERADFGLMLAGHNHGGQIALPGGKAIFGARGKLFPEFAGGFYTEGEAAMIVSKGLGVRGIPFRLFAPPEVVVIELKKG